MDKVRIEDDGTGPKVIYKASGSKEALEAADILDRSVAGQDRGPLARTNAWLDRVTRGWGQFFQVLGRWLAPILATTLTVLACWIAFRAWGYALPGIPGISFLGVVITLGLVWSSVRAKQEAFAGDWRQSSAFGFIAVLLLIGNMVASTALQSAMALRQDSQYQATVDAIASKQRELRVLETRQAVAPLNSVETLEMKAQAIAVRQASQQALCDAPRPSRAACVQAQELAALLAEANAETLEAQAYIQTQKRILELQMEIAEAQAQKPEPAGLSQIARQIGVDQTVTAYAMPVFVTLVVDLLAAALCMAAFGARREKW